MRVTASTDRPVASRQHSRRAASAVEFAVVGTAFFILVLGLVELGRAFMVQHLLLAAARQGARVGIVPGKSNSDISTAVAAVMDPAGITSDHINVTVNDGVANASTATTGQDITVQVYVDVGSVSWLPFTNYLSGYLSAQYTLKRQ
jgi:Flp pilus assembly protein TadG